MKHRFLTLVLMCALWPAGAFAHGFSAGRTMAGLFVSAICITGLIILVLTKAPTAKRLKASIPILLLIFITHIVCNTMDISELLAYVLGIIALFVVWLSNFYVKHSK